MNAYKIDTKFKGIYIVHGNTPEEALEVLKIRLGAETPITSAFPVR